MSVSHANIRRSLVKPHSRFLLSAKIAFLPVRGTRRANYLSISTPDTYCDANSMPRTQPFVPLRAPSSDEYVTSVALAKVGRSSRCPVLFSRVEMNSVALSKLGAVFSGVRILLLLIAWRVEGREPSPPQILASIEDSHPMPTTSAPNNAERLGAQPTLLDLQPIPDKSSIEISDTGTPGTYRVTASNDLISSSDMTWPCACRLSAVHLYSSPACIPLFQPSIASKISCMARDSRNYPMSFERLREWKDEVRSHYFTSPSLPTSHNNYRDRRNDAIVSSHAHSFVVFTSPLVSTPKIKNSQNSKTKSRQRRANDI
ncbi:uncharacterized protein MYCFIDRAFT_206349 [Pseudocercospora fijiensis CIRAD86]|uniref:Uncharacterized protein n=1 Tax=Pseudocercospora fijiensis (strain CIRAD86) TaxID=383855 RepID=N1QCJ8_PSEFD|nr:uncharacterized protein MYCFIDRAFT_206349 [Pseudocercospora fijiensis CIRAD86]EME89422.1 hypothetical protein MYCFIDRAFT_206349 [Pseudocercospora fijiensis CIRAD86]